nr:hypothetical protein L204_04335 [Cryptococcus depauperatus CBS 7855]
MKRLETNKDGDRQHPSSHRPHHAFQLRRKDTRDEDEDLQNVSTWPRYIMRMRHWRSFAKYCPLISATLAPLSTLMDIPALTQRWYSKYGVTQPDPTASLVLSAVGLALNVIANILLVVRFSSKKPFWVTHSTRWSLYFWLGKTLVAAVNLTLFGIVTRNSPGYQYQEGFWCAIVSIIDSGIICCTLLLHYFLAFGHSKSDNSDIRNEGRRFMLSVTAFLTILAIQSLVFSQIEGWDYVSGIYMSVQTALTIGYGDYVPTTTAGKVLIFPFCVLTISQLGNEIALIITFISEKADERRGKWRKKFELALHQEAHLKRPQAGLTEEMALVYKINAKEEIMNQLYDLMWSALALIIFWVLGATAFSQIEGWSFGNAIYACMVLSLTIGFGDFTPKQPGGKVVFIVYALMAVPIVTSFAVQTITGLLSTFSQRDVIRQTFIMEQQRSPKAFAPHSDYVAHYHKSYSDLKNRVSDKVSDNINGGAGNAKESQSVDIDDTKRIAEDVMGDDSTLKQDPQQNDKEEPRQVGASDAGETLARSLISDNDAINQDSVGEDVQQRKPSEQFIISKRERQLEQDLLKQLLEKVVQFEVEARQMLLNSMEKSVERTLLLADRNVQVRDVWALRGDSASVIAAWAGEEKHQSDKDSSRNNSDRLHHNGDPDMLQRVSDYRSMFAEILVLGGILQKLEGTDLKTFVRWKETNTEENSEGDECMSQEGHIGLDGRPRDMEEVGESKWGDLMSGMVRKLWRVKEPKEHKEKPVVEGIV